MPSSFKTISIPLEFTKETREEKNNETFAVDRDVVDLKQQELFDNRKEVIEIINRLDLDSLSPLEALNQLSIMKDKLDD